jgi:hypothetical protein
MKTPTIYDIKYDTQGKSPYFFSRKSMRFFGQTLKDFRVIKSPSGRIFILANSYFNNHVVGFTFREYIDHNLIVPRNDDDTVLENNKLENILNYIQSH